MLLCYYATNSACHEYDAILMVFFRFVSLCYNLVFHYSTLYTERIDVAYADTELTM